MRPIFIIVVLLMPRGSFAGVQVLDYEPATVELTGTLDLQTFPGRPNYESIKGGDEIERHFYLKLNAGVDVLSKGKHPGVMNAEKEWDVKIMQLSFSPKDDDLWTKVRKIGKGGKVKIKGSLFHRFSGHHHSRILLDVTSVELLDR